MSADQLAKSKRLRAEWLADSREIIAFPNVREDVGLFSQNAGDIFRYNMMLGMMAWRDGDDPSALFSQAIDDIIMYRDDLLSRGMGISELPLSTATILASLLGRQSEFELGECELDVCGDLFLDCHLAKCLQGFAPGNDIRSGFEQLHKAKRHALAIRTYEAYFRLLDLDPSSSEVEQYVAKAEANFSARRKDAYYSGGHDIQGGGQYNDLAVDYRLAAILNYRGIHVESVHRWCW